MTDEMAEAMQNMLEHRARMTRTDRTGWTRQQWIDDARALMDDIDGSVQSLVNGHVLALLDHIAGEQARVDAAVEKVAQAIESEASRSSYRDPYEVTDAYLQAANIARAALRDATHTDAPEVTP